MASGSCDLSTNQGMILDKDDHLIVAYTSPLNTYRIIKQSLAKAGAGDWVLGIEDTTTKPNSMVYLNPEDQVFTGGL